MPPLPVQRLLFRRSDVTGPSNSRGSFVITPSTPSASSARIRSASSTVHT